MVVPQHLVPFLLMVEVQEDMSQTVVDIVVVQVVVLHQLGQVEVVEVVVLQVKVMMGVVYQPVGE